MRSQYDEDEMVELEPEQSGSQRSAAATFMANNWPAVLVAVAGLVAFVAVAIYQVRTRRRQRARLPENIAELAEAAMARGRRAVRRDADDGIGTRLVRAVPKPELPEFDLSQPATLLGVKRTEPRGFAWMGTWLDRAREGIGRRLPMAMPAHAP